MADHFPDSTYPEAHQHAKVARDQLQDDAEVARVLGILTYRLAKGPSDYSRSIQLLQESSRKKTQDPAVFYFLGLAQYSINEFAECKKALLHALSLNLETRFAEDANRILAKLN